MSGHTGDKKFRPLTYAPVLDLMFKRPRRATFAFSIFVGFYWTMLVIIPAIVDLNLSRYEFFFWIFGMLGVSSVYYSTKAGHPADDPAGERERLCEKPSQTTNKRTQENR